MVITSHTLPELETLCAHVAIIDKGQAVAAGPTDVVTCKGEEIEIDACGHFLFFVHFSDAGAAFVTKAPNQFHFAEVAVVQPLNGFAHARV